MDHVLRLERTPRNPAAAGAADHAASSSDGTRRQRRPCSDISVTTIVWWVRFEAMDNQEVARPGVGIGRPVTQVWSGI